VTCAVFPAAALPINLQQRTLFTETAHPKADGDEASRNCTLTLGGHLATAVERQDLPQSSRSWKSAVRLDWGLRGNRTHRQGAQRRGIVWEAALPTVVVGDGHCRVINVIDLLFRDGVLKLCDTQTFAMPTKSTFAK